MLVGLVVSGCTAPEINFGNCVATCSTDSSCGNGMECRGGFCVEHGWEGSCTTVPTAGTGGASGATGGTGAAFPAAAGTGTVLDTANHSGGSGGITSGGAGTGGFLPLAAGGASVNLAAGGNTFNGTATHLGGVSAIGGARDSGWSIAGGGALASGGAAGGSAGSQAGVGGSTGGNATDAGGSGTCALSIPAQALSDGCEGEVYSNQLQASGANDAEWSATLPSDLGLTLSTDGKLSGTLRTVGEHSLDVRVTSRTTGCVATRRLTLTVNGESMIACPTIRVKNKNSSALAPASCVAWPYAADFEVFGGTPPHTWQATNTPPGIAFDSTAQHASGTATTSGDLVLRVTDGKGHIVERSFAVPLRDKCWFAYISSESGAQRLHLFDPLLGTRLQRPESNSPDLSVTDYKFSPDGKFIAYRVKDGSGDSALWLWQAPGWDHEQQLDLDGSITQYSWSNNGRVLAVAIESGTQTWLGGVNVAGVPDTQTVAGIQNLYELEPIAARVGSELTWYGGDQYVAFRWYMDEYDFDQLSQSTLGQTGFTAVTSPAGAWYDPSLVLYPRDVGFFAMVPATGELGFIAAGSIQPVFHSNVATAPLGPYVASATNKVLLLYGARTTTRPPEAPPLVAIPNCDAILGWAANQVRIPCVDASAGLVKSHTIDPEQQSVATAAVDGSEAYVSGAWKGYRRQVSRTGHWLALATATNVFMASLDSQVPTVTWSAALGAAPQPAELSFSPNEQLIAIHYGPVIRLFTTNQSGSGSHLGNAAISAYACQDEQMSAPDWCGTSTAARQLAWSLDSGVLAFMRDTQQLTAYDLRAFPNGPIEPIPVIQDCGSECIGTGVFQP